MALWWKQQGVSPNEFCMQRLQPNLLRSNNRAKIGKSPCSSCTTSATNTAWLAMATSFTPRRLAFRCCCRLIATLMRSGSAHHRLIGYLLVKTKAALASSAPSCSSQHHHHTTMVAIFHIPANRVPLTSTSRPPSYTRPHHWLHLQPLHQRRQSSPDQRSKQRPIFTWLTPSST